MKLKSLSILSALALLIVTTACQKSSPTRATDLESSASTASVTDAVTGITLTTPTQVTPNNNQQFKYSEQPLLLTVRNAVTTGTTPLTYTFEVANDAAFTSKAYSKEGLAEGGGQTAVRIDTLAGAKTYYWRARASSGSLAGPNTPARAFVVGPQVVLQTPVLGDPPANATVGDQPILNVVAVQRTGPAGPVFYRFEIAEAASFATLVYTATVPERTDLFGYTPHTVAQRLEEKTYFWRVLATDPSSAVSSPYSAVSQFKVQPFSLAQATIVNNAPDLASWEESTHITSIVFTGDAILVDFTKRTGPGRWPESGFGGGGIQYTLGMCLYINGQWYCSAAIQFWEGRELEASGRPNEIAINWFYDSRWGAMQGYQPSQGETVGIFVAQGNLRDFGKTSVKERSDVVLMPFGGTYTVGLGGGASTRRR
jgi:hypothetical protein